MGKKSKSSWQPSREKLKPQKAQPPPSSVVSEKNTPLQQDAIPVALQQSLLNVFRRACTKGSTAEIESTLQELKGHLFNRDFATAFGKNDYLQAYAARWSPSRALGYAQVFSDISSFVAEATGQHRYISEKTLQQEDEPDEDKLESVTDQIKDSLNLDQKSESPATTKDLNIACLGGGAGAEIVGLSGWLKSLKDDESTEDSEPPLPVPYKLDLLNLDIANWETVMTELDQAITTPAVLSNYASAAAKAANVALLPVEDLNSRFLQQDILAADAAQIKELVADMHIVTLMFTLNELYTTSMPKTQTLLYNLTSALRPGALLLVVDSPGSYSAVTINGAEKTYPMQWLLDHTLIGGAAKKGEAVQWEKLLTDESRWFRLPKDLKYPIELENMRYQIHLYRKCETQQMPQT